MPMQIARAKMQYIETGQMDSERELIRVTTSSGKSYFFSTTGRLSKGHGGEILNLVDSLSLPRNDGLKDQIRRERFTKFGLQIRHISEESFPNYLRVWTLAGLARKKKNGPWPSQLQVGRPLRVWFEFDSKSDWPEDLEIQVYQGIDTVTSIENYVLNDEELEQISKTISP